MKIVITTKEFPGEEFKDWTDEQIIEYFCSDLAELIDGASWEVVRDVQKKSAEQTVGVL